MKKLLPWVFTLSTLIAPCYATADDAPLPDATPTLSAQEKADMESTDAAMKASGINYSTSTSTKNAVQPHHFENISDEFHYVSTQATNSCYAKYGTGAANASKALDCMRYLKLSNPHIKAYVMGYSPVMRDTIIFRGVPFSAGSQAARST